MEVPIPRHVLGLAAALASALSLGAGPLEGQDSIPAKDSAFVLPPIEVTASILPFASPDPGSGVPARSVAVEGAEQRAWAVRSAPDLLAGRSPMSLYDDTPVQPRQMRVAVRRRFGG